LRSSSSGCPPGVEVCGRRLPGEVSGDGEDASVIVVAGWEAEFVVDMRGVLDDGLFADDEGPGDVGVAASLGYGEDLLLARRESSESVVVGACAGKHKGDDFGVEHGGAVADAVQVCAEGWYVGDPLFEQVAAAGTGVGEQFEGVTALEVLGEDDDRRVWEVGADLEGGAESFVGVVGGMRMSVTTRSGRCTRA
jgi:hypothetical protein